MGLTIERHVCLTFSDQREIVNEYRRLGVDYPKFFKMDSLSKMAFIASEILLNGYDERFVSRDDVAVVFFNSSSSLAVDIDYQKTIQSNDDYYPSPSLFVYTLPNICAGEVAIRNKFCGETSFFVVEELDIKYIYRIIKNIFGSSNIKFALVGWVENYSRTFEVKMSIISQKQ